MPPEFRGAVYDSTGVAVDGADVNLYDADTTTPSRASTTTDTSGLWSISHATRGRFDVEITNGTDVVRIKARDRFQVDKLQAESASDAPIVGTQVEDANSVQVAIFEGDRATPANGDLAYITLNLSDSAGNQDEQARIGWAATTVANGATQDGDLILYALVNGALTEMLRLDGSAGEMEAVVALRFDDNVNAVFGTGGDATIDYDGTNLVINPALLGAGNIYVTGGGIRIDDNFRLELGTGQDSAISYDGTNMLLSPALVGTGDVRILGARLETVDSEGVSFGTGDDASIFYDGTNLVIQPQDVGTGHVVINDAAMLLINDTSNANMTVGLTINQGAADDQILALKSSDVAHGITDLAETDTYGSGRKITAAEGGLNLVGYSDATRAFQINGRAVTETTTKTTAGLGNVGIVAQLKSAATVGDHGADANLLYIANNATTRFIFDAEGSGHADVEWTTYDTYDDLAVIESMEAELLAGEDESQTERRRMLEQTGVINRDSWHMERGRPRAMVNMTKLAMLHHGALIQANARIKALESRLALTEGN